MTRTAFAALVTAFVVAAAPARAHPAPFSYLDVRVGPDGIVVNVVAHIFDVSHDLQIEPQEQLLDPAFLSQRGDAIAMLLGPRIQLVADGVALVPDSWSSPEPLSDRQGIGIHARFPLARAPGGLSFDAVMFPYDPAHQTFVNVYEGDTLTLQAILDAGRPHLEYFTGSRQGTLALARRFAPVGVRHVLFGPDHLLFLGTLLLLGGSGRQLGRLVLAFVAANAAAFLLTALNLLNPSARIIEPAVALGIVYVGADNLMVRGGRDTREWIAFAFGLIHGFWFASGLRTMDLPARTINWSLLAFDVGIELAQLLVVVVIGSAILSIRARNPAFGRRLATIGSAVAIVVGVYWFVQRVFFPGGLI